jgi:CTP:molybdopterin cytidylyltransferase MocA
VALDGRLLVEHVLDRIVGLPLLPAVVVLRPEAERAQAAALRKGASPVLVPSRNQSESLRAGILAAGDVDGYLILLADQPLVSAPVVRRLIAVWQGGATAVFADGGRGPQPPAILDVRLKERVLAFGGDEGARRIALSRMPGVVWVRFNPGLWQEDIDTPQDLARLEARLRTRRTARTRPRASGGEGLAAPPPEHGRGGGEDRQRHGHGRGRGEAGDAPLRQEGEDPDQVAGSRDPDA